MIRSYQLLLIISVPSGGCSRSDPFGREGLCFGSLTQLRPWHGMQSCAHVRGHLSGSPGPGEVSASRGPAARPPPWQFGSHPTPWACCSCSRRAWIKALPTSYPPRVGPPPSGLCLLRFLSGATHIPRFRGGLHSASARPTGHGHTAASFRLEYPGRPPLSCSQWDTLGVCGPCMALNTGIWMVRMKRIKQRPRLTLTTHSLCALFTMISFRPRCGPPRGLLLSSSAFCR